MQEHYLGTSSLNNHNLLNYNFYSTFYKSNNFVEYWMILLFDVKLNISILICVLIFVLSGGKNE